MGKVGTGADKLGKLVDGDWQENRLLQSRKEGEAGSEMTGELVRAHTDKPSTSKNRSIALPEV